MTLRECYEKIGGDYENTLQRLCREDFVARFLAKFLNDTTYTTLISTVEAKDAAAAFAAAHTLKGLCLNLGLTALLKPTDTLTEALRNGWSDDAPELLTAVISAYENTAAGIRSWQESQ